MRNVACAILLMAGLAASEAAGQMTVQRTVISSEAARKMGEACEAFAKEKGWHVSVWVIDEAGAVALHVSHAGCALAVGRAVSDEGADRTPDRAIQRLL